MLSSMTMLWAKAVIQKVSCVVQNLLSTTSPNAVVVVADELTGSQEYLEANIEREEGRQQGALADFVGSFRMLALRDDFVEEGGGREDKVSEL